MKWKTFAAGAAIGATVLTACSSETPAEQALRECFERHGVDTSHLDPMVDGRGNVIVVSGVDAADALFSQCLEEANRGFE